MILGAISDELNIQYKQSRAKCRLMDEVEIGIGTFILYRLGFHHKEITNETDIRMEHSERYSVSMDF